MNFWDISILAAIALIVGLSLRRMLRKKKSGCPGCCSCCGGSCPSEKTGEK